MPQFLTVQFPADVQESTVPATHGIESNDGLASDLGGGPFEILPI